MEEKVTFHSFDSVTFYRTEIPDIGTVAACIADDRVVRVYRRNSNREKWIRDPSFEGRTVHGLESMLNTIQKIRTA